MEHFLTRGFFSDKQYGSIKGRSTVLQLLTRSSANANVAEILKGNRKYLEASPKATPTFPWVWFYRGSWQTQVVYQI